MTRGRRPSKRPARLAVAAATAIVSLAAMTQLGGQPARAALIAIGKDDNYSVSHDHLLSVPSPGVLQNDTGLLGGTTAVLVSGVSHGTLDLNSNGSFTYQPDAGYVGSDSFRYHPSGFPSPTSTVTIQVTNAAPVARSDSYTWSGGTLTVGAPGVLANDTDADGDTMTVEMVGGGVSGSLDLHPNGSFQLDPGGGFGSSGSFQYRVWDGRVWSSAATVSLTISAAAPTATPTPRPTATPRPTPTPTLIPLPSLPLPSIALPVIPGQLPTPSPTPRATGSPFQDEAATPTPRPTAEGARLLPAASPSSGTRATIDLEAGLRQEPLWDVSSREGIGPNVGIDGVGVMAGFETWAVPAATIGGAGLLVVLFVTLQACGTVIWAPAVRRLRGERRPRRRRRRWAGA
jgi:hypothetical protein